MKASDLGLIEPALSAALSVEEKFPHAVFTSGRRKAADQARAMSQNIVGNSHWIGQTYRPTASSAELQAWVSQHLGASMLEIEAGLLAIMNTWTDHQKGELSAHFSGLAFDVQPSGDTALHAFLGTLGGKFLDREGGLVRWHIQFS